MGVSVYFACAAFRGVSAAIAIWSVAVLIAMLALLPPAAKALEPQERLPDPALEVRARDISAELRCLVCQNQSIDDSDAALAKDLRTIVRQRLKAGDTNTQVFDYVVARYGEFVLLRPRFGWHTLLLWLAPVLLVGGGLYLASRVIRKPVLTSDPAAPLTPLEQAELAALTGQNEPAKRI